jgi:predicted protein tyrosine phosphatase
VTIIVCSLEHMPEVIAARRPSHLVSLLGPASMIGTPAGIDPDRHLKLAVHDICEPAEDMVLPEAAHIETLLTFGETWPAEAPMVVHCWAGVSRSTASAFILACARHPQASEAELAQALRRASPTAFPNPRFVALADDLLGRQGRMSAAIAAMGPRNEEIESQPFDLWPAAA